MRLATRLLALLDRESWGLVWKGIGPALIIPAVTLSLAPHDTWATRAPALIAGAGWFAGSVLLDTVGWLLRSRPKMRGWATKIVLDDVLSDSQRRQLLDRLADCSGTNSADVHEVINIVQELVVPVLSSRRLPAFAAHELAEHVCSGGDEVPDTVTRLLQLSFGPAWAARGLSSATILRRYRDLVLRASPQWRTERKDDYGPTQVKYICDRYALAFRRDTAPEVHSIAVVSFARFYGVNDCQSPQARAAHEQLEPRVQKIMQAALTLPRFQRLNYVKQLGFTSIAVNLDAAHNRLAHVLGTLQAASFSLCCLRGWARESLPETSDVRTGLENEDLANAFLFLACSHDVFHGPMGHTIESLKAVLFGPKHEHGLQIDKELLKACVRRIADGADEPAVEDEFRTNQLTTNPVRDLATRFDPNSDLLRIGRFMRALLEPKHRTDRAQLLGVSPSVVQALADLLDGPLDSDRADYLPRDYLHCGRQNWEGVRQGLATLLGAARVHTSEGLAFDDRGDVVGAFDLVLGAREDAYRTIYDAPQKLAYDAMLQHAVFYFLTREAALDEAAVSSRDVVDAFLALTDDELYHLCYELCGKEGHGNSWFLLRGTVASEPFEVIPGRTCDGATLDVLGKMFVEIQTEQAARRAKEEREDNAVDWASFIPELATRAQVEGAVASEYLLARLLFTSSLGQRVTIERRLWKVLLGQSAIAAWLEKVEPREYHVRLLPEEPLTFLYPSWELRQLCARRPGAKVRLVSLGQAPRDHHIPLRFAQQSAPFPLLYMFVPHGCKRTLGAAISAFTSGSWTE